MSDPKPLTDDELDDLREQALPRGLWARAIARVDRERAENTRLREDRDALQAMVDGCREVVAENDGDFDGDRPIDHVTAVVGYPRAAADGTTEADPRACTPDGPADPPACGEVCATCPIPAPPRPTDD